MSHHYLVPYVGSGRDADPYCPAIEPGSAWAAIDLRPDGTRRDGYAIVAVPTRQDGPRRVYLGDEPAQASTAMRRLLGSRLGVALERSSLNRALAELLVVEARTDGTRWRPLWPTREGLYQIWLGSLRWTMPVLAGGTTLTETFPTAGAITSGQDLTWANVNSTVIVSSTTQAIAGANDTVCEARAEHDLAGVDHYAEFRVAEWNDTSPPTAEVRLGICARFAAAARTYYTFYVSKTSAGARTSVTAKRVAGTLTTLDTDTQTTAQDDDIRVLANGSAISGLRNGSTERGPTTDTAITTGTRAGLQLIRNGNTNATDRGRVDDFVAADVTAPISLVRKGRGPFRASWRGSFRVA